MNTVCGQLLVNTGIDLIPTLCGLAEIDCPTHLEGCDWSGILTNPGFSPQLGHLVIETEFGTYGKPCGYLGRAMRIFSLWFVARKD